MKKAAQITGGRTSAALVHSPVTPGARQALEHVPLRMPSGLGNQGMLKHLQRGSLQRKLAVNQAGDRYEQEADRKADAVMRMPNPATASFPLSTMSLSSVSRLQRCSCAGSSSSGECEECKAKGSLQRSAEAASARTEAPPIVHEALRSPGQPLDMATRNFMEPRFGADFSNVRVHTDEQAAESAKAVSALAYTVGKEVVFGRGNYAPRTSAGQHLIAHELAHTAQQEQAGQGPNLHRKCGTASFRQVPADCNLIHASANDKPKGPRFRFNVNCDDFAPGEREKLEAVADAKNIPPNADVDVLGLASFDGDASFNKSLSCARAAAGADVLRAKGFGANIKSVKATGGVPGTTGDPNFRAVEIAITKKAAPKQDPTFSILGTPSATVVTSQKQPTIDTLLVSHPMADFSLRAEVAMQAAQASDFDDWQIGPLQTAAGTQRQACWRFPAGVTPPPGHKHPREVFVANLKRLPGFLVSDRLDPEPIFASAAERTDLKDVHHGQTAFTFPVISNDTPRMGTTNGLFNITQDPDDSQALLFRQHKFLFLMTDVVARQITTGRVVPLHRVEWFTFMDVAYDPSAGTSIPPVDHVLTSERKKVSDRPFSSSDVPPVVGGPSLNSLDKLEGSWGPSCPPF